MKSKYSLFTRLAAATTNLAFVFTMTGSTTFAAEAQLTQAKFEKTRAQIEESLKHLPKQELRKIQKMYVQQINEGLKTLEAFVGRPEAYRAYVLTQLDSARADLSRVAQTANTDLGAQSERNFEEFRTQILTQTLDPDVAYKRLYEIRERLESLGFMNVLKGTAAVIASIVIGLGGYVLGGTLFVAGFIVVIGSLFTLYSLGVIMIIGGAALCVGTTYLLSDIWNWALE